MNDDTQYNANDGIIKKQELLYSAVKKPFAAKLKAAVSELSGERSAILVDQMLAAIAVLPESDLDMALGIAKSNPNSSFMQRIQENSMTEADLEIYREGGEPPPAAATGWGD